MKDKYYYARMKCNNCDFGLYGGESIAITKGLTADKFSKITECPDCGCKGTLYYYGQGFKDEC